MDKAKTLEVLRGMKFMQRKEEAKRRAAFEVSQREEISRQLLQPRLGGSQTTGEANDKSSSAFLGTAGGRPPRATILYDDSFHAHMYGLSRRSFTEALCCDGATPSISNKEHKDSSLADGTGGSVPLSKDLDVVQKLERSLSSESNVTSDAEVEDLWGGEETEDSPNDPTATAGRRRHSGEKRRAAREGSDQQERQDGRFLVKSSLRAPKLPLRLQESVEQQQHKRRRGE